MPDNEKCPLGLCDGSGVIKYDDNTYTDCQCRKAMHIQNYIIGARIPEGYRNKTFADFSPVNPGEEQMLKNLVEYVDDWEARKVVGSGISLISKQTRIGKSHLACAVAHAIISKYQKSINEDLVVFVNVTNWIDDWRTFLQRFPPEDDQICDAEEKHRQIENLCKLDTRMANCSLLILDDIGEVPGTKWVNSKLYSLIEYRTSNNRPVMITSNHPWEVVKDKYGDDGVRIVDRLKEKSMGNTHLIEAPMVRKMRKKGK